MMIKIKRIYENYSSQDGTRVLVDRLWPRGLSKEKAKLDLWLKNIGPSTELRKWFGHDPEKWQEFRIRYKNELLENKEAVKILRNTMKRNNKITLLFGAKDVDKNEAVVLADFLQNLN